MEDEIRTKEELEREYGVRSYRTEPAVYVGTYHKYASGSLYGAWLDLTRFCDYNEFIDVCRELHHDEDDPELMFQDYENYPDAWFAEGELDEDTFDKIIEFSELDNNMKDAFMEYLDEIDEDTTIDEFKDLYYGEYRSDEDFASEYLENEVYPNYDIPDIIRGNVNMQDVFYDLEQDEFDFSSNYAFYKK